MEDNEFLLDCHKLIEYWCLINFPRRDKHIDLSTFYKGNVKYYQLRLYIGGYDSQWRRFTVDEFKEYIEGIKKESPGYEQLFEEWQQA